MARTRWPPPRPPALAAPLPSCERAAAVEEVTVLRVPEVELEAERPHALRELVGPPAPLDDAEPAPVGERARLLAVRLGGARVRRVAGAAVDEEDATAGRERCPHDRPELVEPLLGHVREP